MENLFLFLATSFVLRIASPRFRRYQICPGCSALLHSAGRTLNIRYTRDGDKLHFNEYAEDGITYGLICVEMPAVHTLNEAENILVHYISRVRKPFHITCNLAMEIEKQRGVITISDYWQDGAGFDWKIKGYSNGKFVALLYVKNIADTTVKNHDAYLDGFRFSGLH